jgi:hypothetical protein
MLNKQRLSCLAIHQPTAMWAGITVLVGGAYFATSPSSNSDREGDI